MSWIVPAAIAAGSIIANAASARRQAKENRKFAEYQNLVNSQMLDKQLAYNTPKMQMQRYQDAGLNPHLIYGQGNPGNQASPQTSADFKPPDIQSITAPLGPLLNQSLMTQSQTQAIDAKTRDTYVVTRLHELQAQVLARNPALNESGYKAIIDSLISSAEIKASESKIRGKAADWFTDKSFKQTLQKDGSMVLDNTSNGWLKMDRELALLDQKFNLGNLDAQIKAEVINSKEFQNSLLEIQKNWMKDGQITPQHIYTFIQMFLMKLLSK